MNRQDRGRRPLVTNDANRHMLQQINQSLKHCSVNQELSPAALKQQAPLQQVNNYGESLTQNGFAFEHPQQNGPQSHEKNYLKPKDRGHYNKRALAEIKDSLESHHNGVSHLGDGVWQEVGPHTKL